MPGQQGDRHEQRFRIRLAMSLLRWIALCIRGGRARAACSWKLEAQYGSTRSERPEPWYPYIFTSPQSVVEAGFAIPNNVIKTSSLRTFLPAR